MVRTSTTKIYSVSGIPGNQNANKAVGNFYVQFNGDLCAYHVPGGSFAMRFTGSDVVYVPDGVGGQYLEVTFDLTVLEGTGIYRSFAGGRNHMVDRSRFRPLGTALPASMNTVFASSAVYNDHCRHADSTD